MSQGSNVRFIPALEDFKGSLSRFSGEAQETLRTAEQFIQRTEEWLEERENYWRHQAHRHQENVRRAEEVLSRCENSGRYDDKGNYHEPDCSGYENSLRLAERRLEEAADELRNVRHWKKVVYEAVSVYISEAQRLGQVLVNDLPRAEALLGRKIVDLLAYVAVAGPVGEATMLSGDGAVQTGGGPWNVVGSIEDVQRLQGGLTKLEGTYIGEPFAAAIREHGTKVRFGEVRDNNNACFDPINNEIVINERFRGRSSNVLAAHLAHEGTHVLWGRKGCLHQEYEAFKNQTEVWNELKGKETDDQSDGWSRVFSRGEWYAIKVIKHYYPHLEADKECKGL